MCLTPCSRYGGCCGFLDVGCFFFVVVRLFVCLCLLLFFVMVTCYFFLSWEKRECFGEITDILTIKEAVSFLTVFVPYCWTVYTITVRFSHNRSGSFWHGSVYFANRSWQLVPYASVHRVIPLDIYKNYYLLLKHLITQIVCKKSINYLLQVNAKNTKIKNFFSKTVCLTFFRRRCLIIVTNIVTSWMIWRHVFWFLFFCSKLTKRSTNLVSFSFHTIIFKRLLGFLCCCYCNVALLLFTCFVIPIEKEDISFCIQHLLFRCRNC